MDIAQVGEEILATPATPVEAGYFSSLELTQFCDALLETMLRAEGIGIAAPQVFDPRAIMYVASRPNARYPDAPEMSPLLLINPTIVAQSEQLTKDWEGCLSVPELRGKVSRPVWADVSYQDITGSRHEIKLEGFVARVFLHEYDHLIGKTWLDHIESASDIMANDVWLKKFGQSANKQ